MFISLLSVTPRRHQSRSESAAGQSATAPVHVIHTGPLQGPGRYDDMTPYYEADIRPGQSLVMPGFTISVEAAAPGRRGQAAGGQMDGPATSTQPVVTVTPADGGTHLMTIGEPQQQQQQPQQQSPALQYHPLAGVMQGSLTRQQADTNYVYREAGGSLEQEMAPQQRQQLQQQQQPMPYPHPHQDAVGFGSPQQQVQTADSDRGWTAHTDMPVGRATYTEARPEIDNIQVTDPTSHQLSPSFCFGIV